jgi:hypothetical protein
MNWNLIIIIGIIVALVLALIFLRWYVRRKVRLKYSQIPAEVLEDFEIAERRLKENKDGKTNPYEILWSSARGREQRRRQPIYPAAIGGSQTNEVGYYEAGRGEEPTASPELPDEPQRRDTVSGRASEANRAVKRKPKRNWA